MPEVGMLLGMLLLGVPRGAYLRFKPLSSWTVTTDNSNLYPIDSGGKFFVLQSAAIRGLRMLGMVSGSGAELPQSSANLFLWVCTDTKGPKSK